MNISHLETFIHVVRLKSFHKAADALFLSQPTVSARIKSLERELDTKLFLRQGRGVLLTEPGKEFITYAEQILQIYDEGKNHLKNQNKRKEIVIGANATIAQYFIPHALPFLKRLNQHQKFKFITATNEALNEKLLRQKIDIAFTTEIENTKVQKHRLLNNHLKLVAFPDHPLKYEENITIEQLVEEELVICDLGTKAEQKIQQLFYDAKVEPQITSNVNHIEVAKAVLKNHRAIGFLPDICIKDELKNGELIEIDIRHIFRYEQPVFLSYTNAEINYKGLLRDIEMAAKTFSIE